MAEKRPPTGGSRGVPTTPVQRPAGTAGGTTGGTTAGTTTRPPGTTTGANARVAGTTAGTTTRPPGATTGSTTRPPGTTTGANARLPGMTTGAPGAIRPPPERPSQPSPEVPVPKNSLDEVERALSALDGRHHDAMRVQRETQLAAAAKRAAVEAAADEEEAHEKRVGALRVVLGLVGVAALAGAGWYGSRWYRAQVAAEAALAPLAAPYLAAGWKTLPRPLWRPRKSTETMVGGGTCILALASTSPGNGKLVLERPSGTVTAETSIAFCTCGDERVVVHTEGGLPGGVQVLFQEAVAVGGSNALAFLVPRPKTLAGQTCPVDPLDAWLLAGKGVSPPTAAALAAPAKDALEASGWKLAASAPPDLPFAVVAGAAESCFVALSSDPGEALSLRDAGGERPLHPASGASLGLGWCTHVARPLTVWHAGTGTVVVYRLASARVGGTLGLREKAGALGLGDLPIWGAGGRARLGRKRAPPDERSAARGHHDAGRRAARPALARRLADARCGEGPGRPR